MITMILAMDKNNLMGNTKNKNGLPWYYKEDLQFYKENTINKINIMGRKTFEQMGGPLKNRTTIVLSRNKNLTYDGIEVINSIDKYLNYKEEIMLVGGVEIFKSHINYVNKILLTRIHDIHEGDIFYKELNLENFKLVDFYLGKNNSLEFQTWERNE